MEVQSSGQVTSRQLPSLIIGSMVKVWPGFITPMALFSEGRRGKEEGGKCVCGGGGRGVGGGGGGGERKRGREKELDRTSNSLNIFYLNYSLE